MANKWRDFPLISSVEMGSHRAPIYGGHDHDGPSSYFALFSSPKSVFFSPTRHFCYLYAHSGSVWRHQYTEFIPGSFLKIWWQYQGWSGFRCDEPGPTKIECAGGSPGDVEHV